MKTRIFIVGLLIALIATLAISQTVTTNQTLNISVAQVVKMTVSSPTVNLAITDGVAGEEDLTAATGTSTYSITQNVGNTMKITAVLSAGGPIPADVTVGLSMSSTKGSSTPILNLTETAQDVVTDIARGADKDQNMTYTMNAKATVAPFNESKTVLLTLTN